MCLLPANLLRGDKRSSKKSSQAGSGDALEALFLAILNQDLAKVQSLLESLEVGDLNGHNEDGFTPLDLAIMCANPAISRLLQSHGARDSQQCECRLCGTEWEGEGEGEGRGVGGAGWRGGVWVVQGGGGGVWVRRSRIGGNVFLLH